MRHGYGGKYLKELHKSAMYQGQGFGKDASKFGKEHFYLLCSGSNSSQSSSASHKSSVHIHIFKTFKE